MGDERIPVAMRREILRHREMRNAYAWIAGVSARGGGGSGTQHQPTAGCVGLGRCRSTRASRSTAIGRSNGSAIQVALKSVLLEPG